MDISPIQMTQHDARQTRRSLLLGIAVWFLHLNTLNALNSVSCKWGWFPFTLAGISGLQAVQALISVFAMLVLLLLIYLPWRQWRRFQTEKPARNPHLVQDTEKDRFPLMASVVMLLNSLLLLFVVATFVPMLTLNVCGQA